MTRGQGRGCKYSIRPTANVAVRSSCCLNSRQDTWQISKIAVPGERLNEGRVYISVGTYREKEDEKD